MIQYDVAGRIKDDSVNSKGISSFADIYGGGQGRHFRNTNRTIAEESNENTWYCAGASNCAILRWSIRPPNNTVFAYPFIAPYRGGRISGIAVSLSRTAVGTRGISFGIYANSGVQMLYPDELLLYTSGTYNSATTGTYKYAVDFELDSGELYWMTIHTPDATTEQFRGQTVIGMQNLLGFDGELQITPAMGYYSSGVIYNSSWLPNPFPTGAHMLTAEPLPAVFYSLSR